MNPGIVDAGYASQLLPRQLLGNPRPVDMPYGRAGDPLWGSVQLLTTLGATHGSRSFTDISPTPKTIAANADAVASGQVTLFGVNTARLDGSSDSITSASSPAFAMGSGDFTAELFVWFESLPAGQQSLLNVPVSGGFSLYWTGPSFFGSGTNRLIVSNRSANQLNMPWLPQVQTWHHVAVCRASGQLRAFVNGEVIGEAASAVNYAQASLQIGGASDGAAWSITGHVGNVRITRAARYSSRFSPVSAPFPVGYQ